MPVPGHCGWRCRRCGVCRHPDQPLPAATHWPSAHATRRWRLFPSARYPPVPRHRKAPVPVAVTAGTSGRICPAERARQRSSGAYAEGALRRLRHREAARISRVDGTWATVGSTLLIPSPARPADPVGRRPPPGDDGAKIPDLLPTTSQGRGEPVYSGNAPRRASKYAGIPATGLP